MIRAIVFDYGGTLADTKVPWDAVSNRIVETLEYMDIRVDPVELERSLKDTLEYRHQLHEEGYELGPNEFFNHAFKPFKHRLDEDITEELALIVYEESITTFAENLEGTLIELSDQYMLALLSNSWNEAPRQILRDNGYGRWFKALLLSYDVGIPKPDPRVFRHTLDLLGVHASEAVMVGDSLDADIKGASAAGLKGVLVHDGFSQWDGPKVLEIDELPDLIYGLDV